MAGKLKPKKGNLLNVTTMRYFPHFSKWWNEVQTNYDISKITALGNDTTWTQVFQLPAQIFFFSYPLPLGTFDAKVC